MYASKYNIPRGLGELRAANTKECHHPVKKKKKEKKIIPHEKRPRSFSIPFGLMSLHDVI